MQRLGEGESLEQRIALAVNAFATPVSGLITQGWISVVAEPGSDVYVQQVASANPGQGGFVPELLYADNASFNDSGSIANVNSYTDLLISSAIPASTSVGGSTYSGPTYPFMPAPNGTPSNRTDFVLGATFADTFDPMFAQISNGVGGTWLIQKPTGFGAPVTISPVVAVGPTPIGAILSEIGASSAAANIAQLSVSWNTNEVGGNGLLADSPPSLDVITYNGGTTERDIAPTSPDRFFMPLPAPAGFPADQPYTIAQGTLSGTFSFSQYGFSTRFTTQTYNGSRIVFDADSDSYSNTNDFGVAFCIARSAGNYFLTAQATFQYRNGVPGISFEFADAAFLVSNGIILSRLTFAGFMPPGKVDVVANYAVLGAPDAAISNAVLAAGQDISRRVSVDMPAPGSTISVESPIVVGAGVPTHFVDLRASNVVLNAPVAAGTSFTVGSSRSGYSTCEQIFFNADMAAQTYDLRVSNDANIGSTTRSLLYVSPSGSLDGGAQNAQSLYVQVDDGDIRIEGTVAANLQTWLMQSAEPLLVTDIPTDPYIFTTNAQISSASTGLIIGNAVAVTLGNDLPTAFDGADIGGATSLNVVTLNTQINSLRLKAADRQNNALAIPFPYDLLITEQDDISLDAVAASSRTIEVQANRNLNVNATLASASDVILTSLAGQVNLNAPLSTIFGAISIEANSLSIGNSVRVLDTVRDDNAVDIALTARSGGMTLSGPISAVNGILLSQNGSSGANGLAISGSTRLIADRLEVQAAGPVSVRSNVNVLSGAAVGGITIDEADQLLVDGFSAGGGYFRATVGGQDVTDDANGTSGMVAALTARLQDVTQLSASAPAGSIDVFVDSTTSLVMGDLNAIRNRTATSMSAAGSVTVATSAAGMQVFDAPVAGSTAKFVAAASTANLPAKFSAQTAGVYSATLTVPDTLATDPSNNLLSKFVSALDNVADLRIGDTVLLKDQDDPVQNGLYRVVSLGSAKSKWLLARSDDFDTSAEAKLNTWIKALRGEKNSSKLYRLASFTVDNPAIDTDGAFFTKRTCTSVINTGSSFAVKAVSSALLQASYDGSTLTAVNKEGIPAFDGVALGLGDIVLVRYGNVATAAGGAPGLPDSRSIGVYSVTTVGDADTQWVLTRVDDFVVGRVIANEGTQRAAATGSAFEVAYDFLNTLPLIFQEDAAGDNLEIGSQDSNDSVEFVVSTNLGTNTSTGSLGKMLQLFGNNAFLVQNPDVDSQFDQQVQTLSFGNNIGGTIQLTQELPQVLKTVQIDAGAARVPLGGTGGAAVVLPIVIDGTRITTHADFRPVLTTGDAVQGFVFRGPQASGSVLGGVTMGGFSKGSAVLLDGASDVLVSGVKLGEDAAGRKLVNKNGISIDNDVGGFTSIINSTIRSSSNAAIAVSEDVGNRVRIVGCTLGSTGFENAFGVNASNGKVLLGATALDVSLRRISATVSTVTTTLPSGGTVSSQSTNKFTLPPGFDTTQLRNGLGVISSRITPPANSGVAIITSIATTATGLTEVTIDGTISSGTASVLVDIGIFVQPVDSDKADVIRVPAGIDDRNLFLGQGLSGVNVATGTTISQIKFDEDAGEYRIALSKPLLRPDLQTAVFAAAGRNQINSNNVGVVQSGGELRVINTTIGSSVFDGIRLDGGKATIGLGQDTLPGVDGRVPSKDVTAESNRVFGSGQAGIRIGRASSVADVVIQGNVFGLAANGSPSPNKSGNIFAVADNASGLEVVNATKTGSVFKVLNASGETATPDGSRLLITMANHGLRSDTYVWLRIGSAPTAGNTYKVTRENANQFYAVLFGTKTLPPKPDEGATVSVFLYGTKDRSNELANTASFDFEGNSHGIAVSPPTPFSTSTTQPVPNKNGSGATASRPVVKPISRPRIR